MSAFLLDSNEIGTLGHAFAHTANGGSRTAARRAARILAEQNIASVEFRYADLVGHSAVDFLGISNDEYVAECMKAAAGSLKSRPIGTDLNKLSRSYDYQACETEGFIHSEAAKISRAVANIATAVATIDCADCGKATPEHEVNWNQCPECADADDRRADEA